MIQLRFSAGPRSGQRITLRTALGTIGRAPSCDVVVDDPMVSAIHCTFEEVPAGYIVTDQQSQNGTIINGTRVFRALLRLGDELVLGSTGMVVESSDGVVATLFGFRAHRSSAPPPAAEPRLLPTGRMRKLAPEEMTMAERDAAVAAAAPGEKTLSDADAAPKPEAPLILEIVGADGQGVTTVPIPPGGLTVGRHPDCGCVVSDPQVSGFHLKLIGGPQGPVVTDLGSSNGTFIGGELLPQQKGRLIKPDEVVRIGNLSLRVREARQSAVVAAAAPRPAPAPPGWFLDLVVEGGSLDRREITAVQPLSLGRLPTSSLVLSDPQASGQHAEVVLAGDGPYLSDLGSKNGTFRIGADGKETRLEPRRAIKLASGDTVRIGGVLLKVLQFFPGAGAPVGPTAPPRELPPEVLALGRARSEAEAEAARAAADDAGAVEHLPKVLRGAKLVFIAGPRAGTALGTIDLERVVTRIGRHSDNDITLEDGSVSARHCALVADERGFLLRDNQSTNGCFVNGERVVGERLLESGDLIRVGLDSVFEFSLAGAARATLARSVVADGAMPGELSPRFVVRGAVLKQPRIVIGRDVACDVFIDDPEVPRHAVEIVFTDLTFVARPLAPSALRVNQRTVAEKTLATGDVLTFGLWAVRVEVSGARLTVHEKLDHASLNTSWAREAESPAQAPVVPEAVQPVSGSGRQVFQTLFQADAEALQKLVPKREKKRAAPKWKATSDLLGDKNRGGAALLGLCIAAICLGAILLLKREQAFLDGTLSRGHDSARFTALAAQHGLPGGCASCHTPMKGVVMERCQGCHTGFAPRAGKGPRLGHDHVSAKLACASCHDAFRPPHQNVKPEPASPFIQTVKMDAPGDLTMPAGGGRVAQDRLHELHADVRHKCKACHTAGDGVSAGSATAACFRCHEEKAVRALLGTGGAPKDAGACLGCHSMHEQTLVRVPAGELGPRWLGPVSPVKNGVVLAGALLLLVIGVGGFARAYFRRRVDHVARLALADPAEASQKAPRAPAAAGEVERANDHAGVKLKVNVNKEKCVGCACCVNACPTAVLEIVAHKSTVVAEANCTSCRECETVCPSGALTMAPEGAPPRLIDLPDLDAHYQTNVPGLYLIGEAAGKSLVKNAANLGRVVVEHMIACGLQPGDAQRLGADVEVLAVGSGPGGLSAAVTARAMGLSYAVVEKDRTWASTIQSCPKGKLFLAEPVEVKNISPLPIEDEAKELLIARWKEVLDRHRIIIRLGEEVLDIERQGEVFLVTTSKGVIRALRVVMSPGTRGAPRKLGVPGQDLEKVSYMLVDPEEHQGQHLLVVGGGDSAVECAMALADQPGNQVTVSYRRASFDRIKPRNLERLTRYLNEGRLKVIYNSQPVVIRERTVVLQVKDGERTEEVEVQNQFVYCMLGADLPTVWLQQLGVRYVQKPEGWNPGPTDAIVLPSGEVAA
jgi:pSer/pThr/pTyr-binding forkhead associated (FHA) protein/thioredoxin reductase/ferredoxin